MLTWSCCSWTPDLGIHHGWGTGSRGCWRCRRSPGSKVGFQRRAWPCWGSGLKPAPPGRKVEALRREGPCVETHTIRMGMWPTFVLAVRRMGSSQPHQSYEQHHRPHGLHEEPTLREEQPSPSDTFLSVESNAVLYGCLNAVFES